MRSAWSSENITRSGSNRTGIAPRRHPFTGHGDRDRRGRFRPRPRAPMGHARAGTRPLFPGLLEPLGFLLFLGGLAGCLLDVLLGVLALGHVVSPCLEVI